MSNDLVKQLRFTADDVCRCGTSVCLEAADRIEKLEAALMHIYAWYPISIADLYQTIEEIRKFARNSLEGEDD